MLTYDPITTVAPAECKAQPSTRGCGKRFAAIVTIDFREERHWSYRCRMFQRMCDRATNHLRGRPLYDIRAIYCDHCNRVIFWTEWLGVEITKPLIIASVEVVRNFLLRHPEAAGVDQA